VVSKHTVSTHAGIRKLSVPLDNMFRAVFINTASRGAMRTPGETREVALSFKRCTSRFSTRSSLVSAFCTTSSPLIARNNVVNQLHLRPLKPNFVKFEPRACAVRTSSSGSDGGQSQKASSEKPGGKEGEEPMSQEIVLTPGEKVVVGTRLFFWAGAFAFASVCAYYIGKELFPTKMSPNNVFDKATDVIRTNSEVKRRFGETFKTYGRDHGGHREGRRNFIEHTEYVNQDDGSKRTRVRFNLEGPYGQAFVFAEVSKDMPSGEFVYILVQDKRNGQVITVVDNRSALLAKKLAGGNEEGMAALSNLLSGGKK